MKYTCDVIRWQNGKGRLNSDQIAVDSQEHLVLIIVNIFQASAHMNTEHIVF